MLITGGQIWLHAVGLSFPLNSPDAAQSIDMNWFHFIVDLLFVSMHACVSSQTERHAALYKWNDKSRRCKIVDKFVFSSSFFVLQIAWAAVWFEPRLDRREGTFRCK